MATSSLGLPEPLGSILGPVNNLAHSLVYPLEELLLFGGHKAGNSNSSSTDHANHSNSTKGTSPSKPSKQKKVSTPDATQMASIQQVPSIPRLASLPLVGGTSEMDLAVAESVFAFIASAASMPAFVNLAKASSSNLFAQTPFDMKGPSAQSSPPVSVSPIKTLGPPIIPDPTDHSLGPISSVASSFLPSSPLSFVSGALDVPPPDALLTPYSSALSPKTALNKTMKSLLFRAPLSLSQAEAWKSLNLFAVGVSNAYGRVPTSTDEAMNTQFVTSLLADRFPLSAMVFSSLALDILSFVNTTKKFSCPPREAYDPQSLAKMLFLRLSDTPEAFAKVCLDYFRVASLHFTNPLTEHNPPMSVLPALSLGSFANAAGSLSAVVHTEGAEGMGENSSSIHSRDNSYVKQFQVPWTQDETLPIIDRYNSMDTSGLFEAPFKKMQFPSSLLEATEVSLGPISDPVLEALAPFSPIKNVQNELSGLPPITHEDQPTLPLRSPTMSKLKRLRLQKVGLLPRPSTHRGGPSLSLS